MEIKELLSLSEELLKSQDGTQRAKGVEYLSRAAEQGSAEGYVRLINLFAGYSPSDAAVWIARYADANLGGYGLIDILRDCSRLFLGSKTPDQQSDFYNLYIKLGNIASNSSTYTLTLARMLLADTPNKDEIKAKELMTKANLDGAELTAQEKAWIGIDPFYIIKGVIEYSDINALEAAIAEWENNYVKNLNADIYTYKENPISEEAAREYALLEIGKNTKLSPAFKNLVNAGLQPSVKLVYQPIAFLTKQTDRVDAKWSNEDFEGNAVLPKHYEKSSSCAAFACNLPLEVGLKERYHSPVHKSLDIDKLEMLYSKGLDAGKNYWFNAATMSVLCNSVDDNIRTLIESDIRTDVKNLVAREEGLYDIEVPSYRIQYNLKITDIALFFMPLYEFTYICNGKPTKVLIDSKTKRVEIFSDITIESGKKSASNSSSNNISSSTSEAKKDSPMASAVKGLLGIKKPDKSKKKGCYIATSVYGSYNCPEVWVLRRYRDYKLSRTWYGKLFIKIYYALSPAAVRMFGRTKRFNAFWRKRLDKKVQKLKNKGLQDIPYKD